MRNSILLLFGSVACFLAATTATVTAQKQARSYDECRELAIERGLTRPSMDSGQRYQRLKAAGLKAHPQGFIARCMAGQQD